jgi:pyruvate-formate lyase-activating enzyme
MTFHPDKVVEGNKIIRHYRSDGRFFDLSVDQSIALKLNGWKGWLCAASQESLYIDFDGFIFVANCRANGPLGSIYDGFSLPDQWISCPKDFCGCGADIMIPKAKSAAELDLLVNLKNRPPRPGVINRLPGQDQDVSAVEVAFPNAVRQVFWDLHRRCNYACSYCWPEVHNNYEEPKPYSLLLKTTQDLMNRFGQGKSMRFLFGGGEPTIIPEFVDWMKFIYESGSQSVVTTNGPRSPAYFRELIKYCNINMSIHFEFADTDRIVQNVEAIVESIRAREARGGLELKLMCPPGRVDDVIRLKRRLFTIQGFAEHINWSVVPIRSIENNQLLVSYEEAEFERLKREINL